MHIFLFELGLIIIIDHMDQIVNRGWNIKCFDKVKITHVLTGLRLHSTGFQCKNGSYNQAVTCHKTRDQSDWFVVIRPSSSDISYHFQYGDQIVLNNVQNKKYLHLSSQFQSSISKNLQVSLCDVGNGEPPELQDQWIVELAEKSQDQYWRVGEIIKIKNKLSEAYLCSHRRKVRENDDCEVYGLGKKDESEEKQIKDKSKAKEGKEKEKEKQGEAENKLIDQGFWVISEINPFKYTATINQQSKIKITEEAEELNKLAKTKSTIPRKQIKKKDAVSQILKIQNQRLEQLEDERKKIQKSKQKVSCWRRYLCCCCPVQKEGYTKV